jgi:hypothetical protein
MKMTGEFTFSNAIRIAVFVWITLQFVWLIDGLVWGFVR